VNELDARGVVFRVSQLDAGREYAPQGINVVRLAIGFARKEPGPHLEKNGHAVEGRGHFLGDPEERREFLRDGTPVLDGHAPIEQPHRGERADVSHEALTAIGISIATKIAHPRQASRHILDESYQGPALAPMLQQRRCDGFVERRPSKAVRRPDRLGPEPLAPVRRVAEALDVLGLLVEGEADQAVLMPVSGENTPDGAAMGEEVPLPRWLHPGPIDTHASAIVQVFDDLPYGLDRHHRNRVAVVIEWQVALAGICRLDRDPISGPHGLDEVEVAIRVAVLPNPLGEKALRLVSLLAVACTDEPELGAWAFRLDVHPSTLWSVRFKQTQESVLLAELHHCRSIRRFTSASAIAARSSGQ
jgi:hypothetical protein